MNEPNKETLEAIQQARSMMYPVVYLSRRNLLTLLAKLDCVKAGNPSFCTIIKRDNTNKKYPQTHPAIACIAVENEDYYCDRKPGVMRED